MKFRKAKKSDIKQMFKIITINSPSYPKVRALKEIQEMFSTALHKPTYLVVENQNKIIAFGGFISSWVDNMVYNMFWINVHPDYKNKQIGTKLIKNIIKTIEKIKKKPKPKMITISTKIPKYYTKLGFKKISPKYDRNYILMGLTIK